MEGIGHQSLRIENVSSSPFANGHEQIDVQTDPGNTDASVLFVGGSKVGIVMVVMVAVGVSSMQTTVRKRSHRK